MRRNRRWAAVGKLPEVYRYCREKPKCAGRQGDGHHVAQPHTRRSAGHSNRVRSATRRSVVQCEARRPRRRFKRAALSVGRNSVGTVVAFSCLLELHRRHTVRSLSTLRRRHVARQLVPSSCAQRSVARLPCRAAALPVVPCSSLASRALAIPQRVPTRGTHGTRGSLLPS